MKKIPKYIAIAIIHVCCLIAFIPFAIGQSVKINEVQGCFPPGTPVTLWAQATTGTSEYLRCFEWTSSTGEVINDDWKLMVTVTPQVPTSYILSVIEAGSPIASDTIRISVLGLNNFELPCVVDVKDGPKAVADIADHLGDCCDAGFTYAPAQLHLPLNVATETVQVTATCGNSTITREVILINSDVAIAQLQLSVKPDYKFSISGSVEGNPYEHKYDFSKIGTMITNLSTNIEKIPLPKPINIEPPIYTASGEINSKYMACPNADNCLQTKTTVAGQMSIFMGRIEAGILVGTPVVAASASLLFTGNLEVGLSGNTTCEGGEICGNVGVDFTTTGTLALIGGTGLVSGEGYLTWGVDAGGSICVEIPDYKFKPSFKMGTKDLVVGGRVVVAWGFASRGMKYTLLKGKPDIVTMP